MKQMISIIVVAAVAAFSPLAFGHGGRGGVGGGHGFSGAHRYGGGYGYGRQFGGYGYRSRHSSVVFFGGGGYPYSWGYPYYYGYPPYYYPGYSYYPSPYYGSRAYYGYSRTRAHRGQVIRRRTH